MSSLLTAGVAGLLFALGLGLGGMTEPARVQAFLDVAGAWDPTLAFVMGGALAVHAPLSWLIRRRRAPVLAPAFPVISQTRVDKRLLSGAALFGAGWGLAGYCPGPALTSLASESGLVVLFVSSMFGGMWLLGWWERSRAAAPEPGGGLTPP
ncbi:MAG: YeeE/YedE family protein [Myxococcaceae bacterium]|nr:YeeE/YedE family protein [Myxococcaceae bacterium]